MAEPAHSDTAASAKFWQDLAERALGTGIDSLDSRTADGLTVAPLYPRRRDDPPQPWRSQSTWSTAQRVDHPDPEAANGLALRDLEGGAEALVLVGEASPYARGFGVDLAGGLDVLLDRIELDLIDLRLDAGPGTKGALEALSDLVGRRHLTSARLAVDVGFDPIGWRARVGRKGDEDATRILDLRARSGLGGTAFLADGRPYHEAGAGEAQELAAVLATAVAYLRYGEGLGLSLDAARVQIAFLLAADADVFSGLAKFRAMRRLWARVEAACGLEAKPIRLHAETSWRVMTRRDPWTNVMRATAATFAAGLGGADAICVLPLTLRLGLPDAAARRLARNVQRVLLDEAHLGKVTDPAAGAGGFEALTEALAAKAWSLFQAIELKGGISRALAEGHLQALIAATAAQRATRIATMADGIVGASRFASLHAPAIGVLEARPRPEPEACPGALSIRCDAEPFEALRDTAEGITTMIGRPQVFLATLGPPAAFGPRANVAINFFASAGIAAEAVLERRDIAALVAAFTDNDTAIACLCGTDAAYAESAVALASALRAAGACRILLVGRPGEAEAAWRDAGVDAFIHTGIDALHVLGETLDVTGLT